MDSSKAPFSRSAAIMKITAEVGKFFENYFLYGWDFTAINTWVITALSTTVSSFEPSDITHINAVENLNLYIVW